MTVNPYLYFNGQCEAAFKFYEQHLGGQIVAMMTHEGTPMEDHVPADWKTKIIHARMLLGETMLMASDAPPAYYEKPCGFSVSLLCQSAADAERVFTALSENGTVKMPLAETFWAIRFGTVVDQFGTPWMVSCESAA